MASFKRFGAWVIVLKNRYFGDPFFRSEFDIVFLQVIFTGFLILLAVLSGHEFVRNGNILPFSLAAIVITLAFSFFIARVTLAPARSALSSQKRFISDIAHELRTPLSVIKTNCEVTLMQEAITPSIRKMIRSNIEELDRTSEIINNLLSFNTLIRPERIAFTSVDMGLVVDSAVKKMKDFARGKQLELSVKKMQPYMVWGNATALEQIVMNLLKNAITYTPVFGYVGVVVEPDYHGNVILTIKDSGIGIAREDLVHIFEPFYRAERSRSRTHGSSGLGLTIVSELIKLHAGRITIKSSLNHGTTALVFLPRSRNVSQSIHSGVSDEVSIDFSRKGHQ